MTGGPDRAEDNVYKAGKPLRGGGPSSLNIEVPPGRVTSVLCCFLSVLLYYGYCIRLLYRISFQ